MTDPSISLKVLSIEEKNNDDFEKAASIDSIVNLDEDEDEIHADIRPSIESFPLEQTKTETSHEFKSTNVLVMTKTTTDEKIALETIALDEKSKNKKKDGKIKKTSALDGPDEDNDDLKGEEPLKKSSFKDLFRYSDYKEILLFIFGVVMACLAGAILPLNAIFLGTAIESFYPTVDRDVVIDTCINFIGLAFGLGFSNLFAYAAFAILSSRLIRKLRLGCMTAVLSQEVAWFDSMNSNEIVSKISLDTVVLEEGIGQKLTEVIKYFAQFVSGFVIGFTRGWQLALVLTSSIPLLIISMGMLKHFLGQYIAHSTELYARAGGIAEEAFGAIRTVTSLNAQEKLLKSYKDAVALGEKAGAKAAIFQSISVGFIVFTLFCTYALGWWYGGKLLVSGNENFQSVGDVSSVFFAIMIASMGMAQVGPSLAAVFEGTAALENLVQILDRESKIDVETTKKEGFKPALDHQKLDGNIKLTDLAFSYPSRPESKILQDISLDIKAGTTVALVGASGSGKSTIVSLLQRFYDLDGGSIEIDGRNIKDYDLSYLRSQIGLVGQEPILFSGTIADNIYSGKVGAQLENQMNEFGEHYHLDEIKKAATLSNAHGFIEKFPDGYNTLVGDKGVKLSGGQRQRIAIARAVIRNSRILLLDEASSALDSESEKVVQEALDAVMAQSGLTCIVIAHRLSTIRNADVIAVFSNGKIVEQGNHDSLCQLEGGIYHGLLALQQTAAADTASPSKIFDGLDCPSNMMHYDQGDRKESALSKDSDQLQLNNDDNLSMLDEVVISGSNRKIIKRLWNMNKSFRSYVYAGFAFAFLSGAIFPCKSLLLTEMITILGENSNDFDTLTSEINKFAIYYVIFAIAALFIYAINSWYFRMCSEKMSTLIRNRLFKGMLRQDIQWFDEKENSPGALVHSLSAEPALVSSIVGENFGRFLQNISTVLTAIMFAFIFGAWQLSLIMLTILPLLVFVQSAQTKFLRQGNSETKGSMDETSRQATEAVGNIRTVYAYGMEVNILDQYKASLKDAEKNVAFAGVIGGLSIGFTQFLTFAAYSGVFYYGSILVSEGSTTFDRVIRSLMVVMFASLGLAQSSSFITDTTKAFKAAQKHFSIFDRIPPIDINEDINALTPKIFEREDGQDHKEQGKISLNKVKFTYSSRPDQTILKGIKLDIKPGHTVALVGESGCGKSTIISLLERFYNCNSGNITIDDVDIKKLHVSKLRSYIGYVGQEPTLFRGTIGENIAMGLQNQENCSQTSLVNKGEEDPKTDNVPLAVIEAAKMSNAHDFIIGFPEGYHTQVGGGGIQVSGGQKQRIAIARAIISNPPILLLDEATSALDAESERIVQVALDDLLLKQKRTTIVIAHRLASIKTANEIVVMKGGKILEMGNHEELFARNGYYTSLCKNQGIHS